MDLDIAVWSEGARYSVTRSKCKHDKWKTIYTIEEDQWFQTRWPVCLEILLINFNFNSHIVTYRIWRISDAFRLDAYIVTGASSNTTGALALRGESGVSRRACSVAPTNWVWRRPWASFTITQTKILYVCNIWGYVAAWGDNLSEGKSRVFRRISGMVNSVPIICWKQSGSSYDDATQFLRVMTIRGQIYFTHSISQFCVFPLTLHFVLINLLTKCAGGNIDGWGTMFTSRKIAGSSL
jgi:hypothetical protein